MTDVLNEEAAEPTPAKQPQRRPRKRHGRSGTIAGLVLVIALLAFVVGVIGMALTGRSLTLPVWAVAEIEDRLNARLGQSHLPDGAAISVGQIDLALDGDFTPRFRLRDLRLLEPGGVSILALPEISVTLDAQAALSGQIRPSAVRLLGAHVEAQRDAEGRIGLSIGGLSGARDPQGLGETLDALDRMFSSPLLAGLELVEANALSLTLTDARAGRSWELGDGQLVIENGEGGLAGDLRVSLLDGETPAQAQLTIQTEKASSAARILARMDGMASADLAAQAPALAVLGLLEAPISGRLIGTLDQKGELQDIEAELNLGKGAVRPEEGARPVSFDKAELALRYDAGRQRITIGALRLESPSIRMKARGNVLLQDGAGGAALPGRSPERAVVQVLFSEVMVDPEGVFVEPVRFDAGALDLRLTLRPFRAEIGGLTLGRGEEQIRLSGEISTAKEGWSGAIDVALGRIDADRLIRLWPVSVVPKTRAWLAANVGQAEFLDLDAGLRFAPGTEARFALDYDFKEAEVRFIKTLPPVTGGFGRASITGNAYTLVLEGGHVTAPDGGRVDAAGSVFRVPDITKIPADAEVRLQTVSGLTAALSLLDQEPFRFLSKAGRPVDLGEGTARVVSELRFPLVAKIGVEDITYAVTGVVEGFRSSVLVPGKTIEVPEMGVEVTPGGMRLSGQGKLDGLGFDAVFTQPFAPPAGQPALIEAQVRLSDKSLRGLGIALPKGWLQGEALAQVDMTVPKGAPVTLVLKSGLAGAALDIPPLGWRKPAKTKADLLVEARLGAQPEVTRLKLTAADLRAEGSLTTTKGGGMDKLELATLQAGDWLDAEAVLTGRGVGKTPAVAITGGSLDLRKMPRGGSSSSERTEIKVALDQLIVSSGITLANFRGAFLARDGGLDGSFNALVNGKAEIEGAAVPDHGRTAIRITTGNAGRVMAAAGIFRNGRGGRLDVTLSPRGPEGQYVGIAAFSRLSVQDAPTLAALLSAVSVVGLVEQMMGSGLVFDDGDVEFILNPDGVQITRGSAVGTSLGISFEGTYASGSGRLDLQGVISPIYILNGIGQIFARKGEGLFGFNYQLTGTAENPSVSVNPLSILTPGMFREIFRRPPPRLESGG